mgnify:CR=1 FL=1
MKKVLISILIVLIMILTFFVVFKNINIGEWKSKNINDVVFDRGGYLYTGRVQALAEGARSKGLNF